MSEAPLSELHNQENMVSRLRGAAKSRAPAPENRENLPPKTRAAAPENQENLPPRTVLGGLQQNAPSRAQNQRATGKQGGSSQPTCKNEDFSKSCAEKTSKQPVFQIHVDEPDCAVSRRPAAPRVKPAEGSLLHPAMTRLRQPLAPLDLPSAMDVSFGDSPMDMSLIDGEERTQDPSEVPEYAKEIHTYLREVEVKMRPKAGYMKKQPDITGSMRAILVDWLVEVGEEYKLQNETLYLAVNYIDRFLSSMSVLRGKLQLVGTAAMLLASKFEEIYPPEVAEFVYITDDTYTKKQVLRMEHLVLKVLSFDLAAPTINQFLSQYFLHHALNKRVESLAMYLSELSLVDSEPFLKYLPSHTAAAALLLAHHTITGESWPAALWEVSGYSVEDLTPCLQDLHQMFLGASQHAQQSVPDKYKSAKYHEVSLITPPATLNI
ncbi:cyclin-A2 [Gadus morhua]|uniref:Cyclin-A2 n=1 Tax=Gadus morhua TaxID=8049 RepID=A0A8C5F7N7_GADMO|nr:cyclin-A2 [Gadus morhua]